MNLPATLIRTIRDVYPQGEVWLEQLPAHLQTCQARWNIRVLEPFPNLSYNVVAPVLGADGTDYVLKLGVPSEDFLREVAALALYDGDGTVRLVAHLPAIGAMLLERLRPGISFWHTDDDETACRTAASLMQRLWRPVTAPHPFRTLENYADALLQSRADSAPLPQHLVNKARALLRERLKTAEPVLLHADLHHDNILSATREPYLAIDPKGIVGPKGYDVGPFFINPMGTISKHPDLERVLARRVAIFSDMLAMDAREVAAWGLIHAVLSACWSLEDHDTKPDLSYAKVLASFI